MCNKTRYMNTSIDFNDQMPPPDSYIMVHDGNDINVVLFTFDGLSQQSYRLVFDLLTEGIEEHCADCLPPINERQLGTGTMPYKKWALINKNILKCPDHGDWWVDCGNNECDQEVIVE